METQFKEGQEVIISNSGCYYTMGEKFTVKKDGTGLFIRSKYRTMRCEYSSHWTLVTPAEVEPITWETLKAGDYIKRYVELFKIEGRLGDIILSSYVTDKGFHAATTKNRHINEFENSGFTIVQPKNVRKEPKEVTQAEVDAKFGYPVKIKG